MSAATPPGDRGRCRGFTFVELLVVLVMIGIVVGMLLPALGRQKHRVRRMQCAANLQQISLGCKSWRLGKADGRSPDTNSVSGRGSFGAEEVCRRFRAMSKELGPTKTLVCPADTRQPAASFADLSNTNVSYFLGLEAPDSPPQMLVSGDRNVTNGFPCKNGIVELTGNSVAAWTHELHNRAGNVLVADGSVQGVTSSGLNNLLRAGGGAFLLMP